MIITLKGATASKNLGGLNFYSILVNKSSGVTVTLDKTTVDKASASSTTVTGTVTVADGYTLSSVVITMGGTDITSSCYDESTGAITISGITGNVVIKPTATSNSGSGDSGSGGTTPATYTITYKYMCGSTEIKTATTETVAAGTSKTFSVSNAPAIDGYTASGVSPTSATINANITVTYTYTAVAQAETTWYVDYTTLGGNYNFGSAAGAVAFRMPDTYNKCVGVPINALKLIPSGAGTMGYGRVAVDGDTFTHLGEIEITDTDVATEGTSANAKVFKLSETVTLAEGERLAVMEFGQPTTGKIWVSTQASDTAAQVRTNIRSAGASKDETWKLPIGIGYVAE